MQNRINETMHISEVLKQTVMNLEDTRFIKPVNYSLLYGSDIIPNADNVTYAACSDVQTSLQSTHDNNLFTIKPNFN